MELVGLIFGSIAILYSLLTSSCIENFFDSPQNFQTLNQKINLCKIAKNNTRLSQELRDIISEDDNECIVNLTTALCNDILMDAKNYFEALINLTINNFDQDEIQMTLPHVKCIHDTFKKYELVNAYLRLFLDPDVIFNNITGNESEQLSTPIRIVRSFCNADELYSKQFDLHRKDINISNLDTCNVQYLIDKGFVRGNLIERPKYCDTKNFIFEQFINSSFLLSDYSLQNFFALKNFKIQKCFLDKTLEIKLPQQMLGIEYSHALNSSDYSFNDEKIKFINLSTIKDNILIECLVV